MQKQKSIGQSQSGKTSITSARVKQGAKIVKYLTLLFFRKNIAAADDVGLIFER